MSVFAHSKDSRNKDISDLVGVHGWHVFVWKIPNFSAIPHVVDHAVQSPVFRYQNTSRLLKMYPYGQTEYQTEGYIDVIIKNLNASSLKFRCKMHKREDNNNNLNLACKEFSFDSVFKDAKIHKFMRSNEASKRSEPLTLVLECKVTDSRISHWSAESYIKLSESDIDEQVPVIIKAGNEIGEIFKEPAKLSLWWKVYHLPPVPSADYHAPSPQFTFANASWILRAFPHSAMEHSFGRNIRAVLERLHSKVPEQSVTFKVRLLRPFTKDSSGSCIFTSSCSQTEVLQFPYNQDFLFMVELKVKKADVLPVAESPLTLPKNKVLQDLKELFLKQEDCDIIFKVQEREFPAHRLILKARSPVLASALRNDMKEKATGVINVEDCDPLHFSDFLCFLYCGKVDNLTEENVFSLFAVADKYDVPDLRNNCKEFMKHNISIDTFCDTISLALLHSEADLLKQCTDFFVENLKKIIVSVKWQTFIADNPIQGNELLIKALVTDKK